MDTIFALSTARGRAGVAVVRVSGPKAFDAVRGLCGTLPGPHHARVRKLRDTGEVVDEALVIVFPAGASFTGEDVVELHLHGSVAVVARVLEILGRVHGLRSAEAGEFTRRALQNGRLDLTEVEGLADLLAAETEAQRRQAMRGMSGELGALAEAWRSRLIRAAALIEASLDFADEPVPVDVRPEVLVILASLRAAMQAEVSRFPAAERVRQGFEVAIVGAPNVGKSTLLNRLAGREAAITSEFAGTTRDVIEVRMDIADLAVTLLDTAGVRDAADPIEAIGVARALDRAAAADLRVFVVEAGAMPLGVAIDVDDIVLAAKADTGGGISGKTGAGVDDLLSRIAATLGARVAGEPLLTRTRHRALVLTAMEHLALTEALVSADEAGLELAAEHLRVVIASLEALVGRVDVESVLGEIFASFCIGK